MGNKSKSGSGKWAEKRNMVAARLPSAKKAHQWAGVMPPSIGPSVVVWPSAKNGTLRRK